jgi:hypothetical protein
MDAMTTPVSARDHASMTVTEREFTFDALLADFDELENHAHDVETPSALRVDKPGQASDAAAPHSAQVEAAVSAAPEAAAPHSAQDEAAFVGPQPAPPRASTTRRALALPSREVLKLSGLIVLAVLSLTLVFVALAR